jgi:hypothetical protein
VQPWHASRLAYGARRALARPGSPAGPGSTAYGARRGRRCAAGHLETITRERIQRVPGAFRGAIFSPRMLCLALPRRSAERREMAATMARRMAREMARKNGARERMQRARGSECRARGQVRLQGWVARANGGGMRLDPWRARGGWESKGGRARETPRGASAKGQRRTAPKGARKGTARGTKGRGGALIQRAPGASAAPFSRRASWELWRAQWVRQGRSERRRVPRAWRAHDFEAGALSRLLLSGPTREVPPSCSDPSPQVSRSPAC